MADPIEPSDSQQTPEPYIDKIPKLHGHKPDWALVYHLAITGTGINGICKCIAKSKQQLDAWALNDFKISIGHLLDMWKETGHSMLRAAQFKSAVVDGNPLMLKFLGVNVLGQDKEQTVEVQLPRVLLPFRRTDGLDDALPAPDFKILEEAESMEEILPPDLTLLAEFEASQDVRKTYDDMAKLAAKSKKKRKRSKSDPIDQDESDDE